MEVSPEGFQIAVEGGRLTIGKVRPETGGKVEASAFASDKGLKVGDQFSETA